MDFSDAFKAIKGGAAMRRAGWNGKGLKVELGARGSSKDECIPTIPYIVIIGGGVGGASLGSNCGVWFPSMGDLFADDWEEV